MVVRGPHVAIGYWAGPGLIEDALKDGWFHTGDLMRQDEKDNLWFVSRKKDLVVRGGSKISPAEVEQVLRAGPAVQDAAVVGVPDVRLGQRVAGFVQLTNDAPSAIQTKSSPLPPHGLRTTKSRRASQSSIKFPGIRSGRSTAPHYWQYLPEALLNVAFSRTYPLTEIRSLQNVRLHIRRRRSESAPDRKRL